MSKSKMAIYVGRFCGVPALLALIGAWVTQLTGKPLAGQQAEIDQMKAKLDQLNK